ncbi:hypothetical protein [Sphingomonas sp. DT-204]|uniref:hypothetical protein n=1 Tax=Sphingomonas sp. DT-204 TaxID=3396166 RepID=UPI003F1E11F4
MSRPLSIVRFEQFYIAYWLVGLVNTVMSWDRSLSVAMRSPAVAAMGPGFLYATTAVGLAIPALLWFFIARRGSTIAKWILVVLFAIGLVALLFTFMGGRFPTGFSGALALIALVLQAAAVAMLFRPDTRTWFGDSDSEAEEREPEADA